MAMGVYRYVSYLLYALDAKVKKEKMKMEKIIRARLSRTNSTILVAKVSYWRNCRSAPCFMNV